MRPTAETLAPMVRLTPADLAAHLAAMPEGDMQAWIDAVFDVAAAHDLENTIGLFDLAWTCNDIALLLRRGAKPATIYRDPCRGIVAEGRA